MFTTQVMLTFTLAGIAFSVNALHANFSPNTNKVVVVKFFKPGCGPCEKFAPTFNGMIRSFASNKEVTFFEVNAAANSAIARTHQVMSVPTVLVFKNGKVIWRGNGKNISAASLTQILHNALAA